MNVNVVSTVMTSDIGEKWWRYLGLQRLLGNLERIQLGKDLDQNGVVGASGHGLGGE